MNAVEWLETRAAGLLEDARASTGETAARYRWLADELFAAASSIRTTDLPAAKETAA